jgi:hypothetical protein
MIIKLLIIFLVGILIGYNLGFKKGKEKGKAIGLNEAPLIILEESLKKGYCILCKEQKLTG